MKDIPPVVNAHEIWNVIVEHVRARPTSEGPDPLEPFCAAGRAFVLFDGLDEFAVFRKDDVQPLLQAFQQLRAHRKLNTILTCREMTWKRQLKAETRLTDEYTLIEIEPYGRSDAADIFNDLGVELCGRAKADDNLPARWLCNELALDMANTTFKEAVGPKTIETLSGLYESWAQRLQTQADQYSIPLDFYEQVALLILEKRKTMRLDEVLGAIGLPRDQTAPDADQFHRMQILEVTDEDQHLKFYHHSLHDFFATRNLAGEFLKAIDGTLSQHGMRQLRLASVELDYLQSSAYGFLDEQIRNETPDYHERLRSELSKRLKQHQLAMMPWQVLRNLIEYLGMTCRGEDDDSTVDLLLGVIGSEEPNLSVRVRYNAARALERVHPQAPTPYYDYISDWGEKSWVETWKEVDKLEPHGTSPWVMRGHGEPSPRPGRHKGFGPNTNTPMHDALQQRVSAGLAEILSRLFESESELSIDREYQDSPLTISCTWAWSRWFHRSHSREREDLAVRADQLGLTMTEDNLRNWVGNPIVRP